MPISKKQIIAWQVIIKCNQGEMGLIINAANCIHCKTCDIKVNRIYLNLADRFLHEFQNPGHNSKH